ncbi:sulfurtransferase [Corynebacterium kroppenstedtii]|uniref:sulfurtransferase n=1 Tax=Corynebacterium sp. PCR 32 TaxID=3351342 RepID=UPI00309BE9A5
MTVYVSPEILSRAIHKSNRISIVSTHWSDGSCTAYSRFVSEHIPAAQFCPPELALTGLPSREDGRNPLPNKEVLQEWVLRWGLDRKTPIVIYGQHHGIYSARAWWVLKWAGFTDLHILDGGLARWEADGHPVIAGPGSLPRRFQTMISVGHMPTIDVDEVDQWIQDGGILLDARDERRFNGIAEKLDFRAGHIPGAVNMPVRDFFNDDRTVCSPDDIRSRFDDAGISDASRVAVYSGSGLHSCAMVAVMEHAGIYGARLFPGGWSQWAGNPNNPIERVRG